MTYTTTTARQARPPALTTRLAAMCRDPRSYCALVLAANAGLVACAAAEPFTAALLLHLVLLPFNAWRLLLALRAGRSTRALVVATMTADAMAARQRVESRGSTCDVGATTPTVRLSPRGTLRRT